MLPRSRAHYMIFSSSHDHGPALSFFHTATITGQFYHFLKQPRSRVCVIIFFFFLYTATITGQFYHFLKQPRSRACVIIFFFFIPPRSRARFPIFSCCLDHGPAYHFQAATITGLHSNVMNIYCLDHGKFRNRQ